MAWELVDNIRGPKGEKGDAGTIDSVSVATLPAGSAATAEMTGTAFKHVHLGIPRGEKGEQGVAGTLSSASAESIPAGESAAVVMSGTTEVKHAHFKVPRGLPGVNAVENDEAVATYLRATDSLTNAGLRDAQRAMIGPVRFPSPYTPAGAPALPVSVVPSDDPSSVIEGNIYGSGYQTPSGIGLRHGSRTELTPDARPTLWVQKFSSANRATNSSEWDQGGYFAVEKHAGDAYVAGVTGYVRHDSTDGGDAIGVHGRGSAYQANSEVWGGWFYAYAGNPAIVPQSIIGAEINLNSRVPDQGYNPAIGYSKGLLVVTQDSSLPVSIGIEVGRGSNAPDGYIHTGIRIRRNSIAAAANNSATEVGMNEAVLIDGSSTGSGAAHGIRFGFGTYRTGVSFAEGSFSNNAAILLGDAQRIVVGPGAGVSTYMEFSRTNSVVNLSNLSLQVNGSKVVGDRRTGWTAATGTATRTGFATSTATTVQVAEALKALIDDLTMHGLIGN